MSEAAHDDDRWLGILAKATALLAMSLAKVKADTSEQAVFLHRLGFTNPEIADLLGAKQNTVKMAKYRARRTKTRKHGKRKNK